MVKINQWPTLERPRERLLTSGCEPLSTAELIAIIINCGSHGNTAIDLARHLLSQFANLRQLITANPKELYKITGVGPAKYCQLQAAIELGKRYFKETLPKTQTITSAMEAQQFLLASLQDQEQEIFACLFLDSRHQIIHFEKLFFGSINSTVIYPREIIKRALRHNAAAIIIAHNHPSGNPEPSQADITMTQQLKIVCQPLDIRLLDHLIIGNQAVTSLADRAFIAD